MRPSVYQFLSPLGAATALSPVLMATIEGLRGEQSGISFMLFNYYLRDVNNGTLGVILTLIVDLAFVGLSTLVSPVWTVGYPSFPSAAP